MKEQQKRTYQRKYMTIEELAHYLLVSKKTLYAWVSERKIPFTKVGRALRFSVVDIDRWLEKNKQEIHEVY